MKLVRIPLEHYRDVLQLLALTHVAPVIGTFDYRGRTVACTHMVNCALDGQVTRLTTAQQAGTPCCTLCTSPV